MVDIAGDDVWMVVVGFLVAFVLALGIGANDVANTFGTSVGAKVLTLRQACILATIFEILGAILLGAKVSETIRSGIIDVAPYENQTELLMAGNVASLTGSCVWLIIATAFKMPVSGTHSIVGATIGFALVAKGMSGIHWDQVGMIIGSWFISPVLAGLVSTGLFFICKYFILSKEDPLEPGLRFLPLFYACTITINVFSIFYNGPPLLQFHRIPLWGIFIASFGIGIIVAFVVRFVVVPWQRRVITAAQLNAEGLPEKVELTKDAPATETKEQVIQNGVLKEPPSDPSDVKLALEDSVDTVTTEEDPEDIKSLIKDRPEQARLFSFLQILTAVFGSFAHGGNDVSNAIGPLISIWLVATVGVIQDGVPTPLWILFYGGIGISVGLWVWGRRVIQTIGEDLAKITPSSGFCIEIGAAFTVLVASNIGIPISSTHSKVGSIVFVGRFRSKENVDWSLFRNIIGAWLLPLPISGGISAAVMAGLRLAVPH